MTTTRLLPGYIGIEHHPYVSYTVLTARPPNVSRPAAATRGGHWEAPLLIRMRERKSKMPETFLASVEVPSLRRTRSAKSKTQAKVSQDEGAEETLASSLNKRTKGARANPSLERESDEGNEVTPRKKTRGAMGNTMRKAHKLSDSDEESTPRKRKIRAGGRTSSGKAAEKTFESVTQKRCKRSPALSSSVSPLPPSPEPNAETLKRAKVKHSFSDDPVVGNEAAPSGPSQRQSTLDTGMNDLHPILEPQLNGKTKGKGKNKEKKIREPSLALELSDVELDEQTLEAFIDFVDHLPEKKDTEEGAEGSDAEEEFMPTPLPQK